jgi:hypothetical protein
VTGNAVKSNRFAYTYTGGPHGRHYEAFREEVCRTFGKLDIEPGVPDRLDCGVEIVQVGSLSMGTARGSSGRFLRSRATLSDGCDDFVLINALADKIVVDQNGTSIELRRSEMCLLEMNARRRPTGQTAARRACPENAHRAVLLLVSRRGGFA